MTAALFYFPPQTAAYYHNCRLDSRDQQRLAQSPQLAQNPNWQSSRVGKHLVRNHYPDAPLCLSHKHGHSLIAVGTSKAGVDLEQYQTRDYLALAEKTCSTEEIHRLQNLAPLERQALFYRLWTIKEALIKGQDLRFPTDMPAIGLTWQHELTQIRSPAPRQVQTWLCANLAPNWCFAALWFEPIRELSLYSPSALELSQIMNPSAIHIIPQRLSLDF